MSSELFVSKVNENNSKRKWNGDKNNSESSVNIDRNSTSANSESFRKVFKNGSLVVVSNATQHNAPLDFSTKKRKLDEKIQSLHFTDGQRNCAFNNVNHLGTETGTMKDFVLGDTERQSHSATTPLWQAPNNPADPFHQNYAPSTNGQHANGCQMYNNFLSNLMLAHYRNLLMNSHLGNVINQEHFDRPHSTASSSCLSKCSSNRNPGDSADTVHGYIRQTKTVSSTTPLVTSTTDESRAPPYVPHLEPLSPASPFLNGSPMYLESDCNSTECSAAASPMPRDCTHRKRGKSLPEEIKNECYWERRRKNNEAAKKSRDARRTKEDEISIRSAVLEEENFKLQFEVTSLKAEVEKLKRLLSNF